MHKETERMQRLKLQKWYCRMDYLTVAKLSRMQRETAKGQTQWSS